MTTKHFSTLLIFIALFFFISCNDNSGENQKLTKDDSHETQKLTKDDSEKIAYTHIAKIFKGFSSKTPLNILTEIIPDGEAKPMIKMYMNSKLFQSNIIINESRENIIAFEFDNTIIKTIRDNKNIYGLRVYLGQMKNQRYTLVAVAVDADGKNIKDLNFEWHTPCPPCAVKVNGKYVNPRDPSATTRLSDTDNPLMYYK